MRAPTWHQALAQCEKQGKGYVIITVLAIAGSTPREAGTKMIVTDDSQYDTIGGGHLEHDAVSTARTMLAQGSACQKVVSNPLSSKLGQCCGGAVKVLYEVMVNHQQTLAVFGAGHVAQALVPILAQLPLQIRWIDSRAQFFSEPSEAQENGAFAGQIATAHHNVQSIVNDDPTEELEKLPANAWVVILTHNHQLDYSLIETALQHNALDFIGMIGSATKAKRFTAKLAHRGYSPAQIQQVVSPIGELSINGKRPIEVAVSISAQLIALLNRAEQGKAARPLQATRPHGETV